MTIARLIAAVLLALPMLVFGGNHFLGFFKLPPGDGLEGDQLLQLLRTGGLMHLIAASHVICGVLLLVPCLRFGGALLQLPMTLGILGFHATMLPAGNAMAIGLLALNAIVLWDPARMRALLAPSPA